MCGVEMCGVEMCDENIKVAHEAPLNVALTLRATSS